MKEVMDVLPYIAFINVLLVVLALITKCQVRAFFKAIASCLFAIILIIVVAYLAPENGPNPFKF
jgi:peptidoglycan/LPS O-acetylase OafA/YrhL